MTILKNKKEIILQHIMAMLDSKIDTLIKANESVQESKDLDAKSSAGDKYETGREMMQIEINNNNAQLQTLIKQKREIFQINSEKEYKEIGFGSLVTTDNGSYFISIGLGKINVNEQEVYVISLLSPIGKLFHKKRIGDKVSFRNKEISILDIS